MLGTGQGVGKALADQKSLKSSLRRLDDGRELVVQILDHPKVIGVHDIVLGLRRWHVCDKVVEQPMDLIVNKDCTFAQLKKLVCHHT